MESITTEPLQEEALKRVYSKKWPHLDYLVHTYYRAYSRLEFQVDCGYKMVIFKRSENHLKIIQNSILLSKIKDLSRVKTGFKSVPLQFYFEIGELATAKKRHKIQNRAGEERF